MVLYGNNRFWPKLSQRFMGERTCGEVVFFFFIFNYHIIQNINLDYRKELLSENLGDWRYPPPWWRQLEDGTPGTGRGKIGKWAANRKAPMIYMGYLWIFMDIPYTNLRSFQSLTHFENIWNWDAHPGSVWNSPGLYTIFFGDIPTMVN